MRGKKMAAYVTKGTNGEDKYLRLCLRNSGAKKNHFVHRLVAKAFVDNPEGKPFINHKNGVKTDNRPENLEWVTQSENQQHSYDTGLQSPNNGIKFANNTSGYVGVTKCGNKWKAQIRTGGELRYLGLYMSPLEASEVYQLALKELMVEGALKARNK